MGLLTAGAANTKTAKGAELGILNAILHLAPASVSGFNVCPFASKGCASACLNTAGRGQFQSTQDARIRKTIALMTDPATFTAQLAKEIDALVRKGIKLGKRVAVRLNGTSDILWENYAVEYKGTAYPNLMSAFPTVQFYDYTKVPVARRPNVPANYDLTFSLSEGNDRHAIAALAAGYNVAAVLTELAETFGGYPIIDGDTHDFRFLDTRGVIVGLKAKGKAVKDRSGFVRNPADGFDTSRKLSLALQKVA